MERNVPQQEDIAPKTLKLGGLSHAWVGTGIMPFGEWTSHSELHAFGDIEKGIIVSNHLFS